jgi:predicted nucleic acid-binding protein
VKVVLDASAALEIALNRKNAGPFVKTLKDADLRLAPDLLIPEAVNAVWKEHHFGGCDLGICEEALDIVVNLVSAWVPCGELYPEAFHLSLLARKPAYDMFYLALARREGAVLLTLDAALRKEAVRQGIRVV